MDRTRKWTNDEQKRRILQTLIPFPPPSHLPSCSCFRYALSLARFHKFPESKQKGLRGLPEMRVFTSQHAHYSIKVSPWTDRRGVAFHGVAGLGAVCRRHVSASPFLATCRFPFFYGAVCFFLFCFVFFFHNNFPLVTWHFWKGGNETENHGETWYFSSLIASFLLLLASLLLPSLWLLKVCDGIYQLSPINGLLSTETDMIQPSLSCLFVRARVLNIIGASRQSWQMLT